MACNDHGLFLEATGQTNCREPLQSFKVDLGPCSSWEQLQRTSKSGFPDSCTASPFYMEGCKWNLSQGNCRAWPPMQGHMDWSLEALSSQLVKNVGKGWAAGTPWTLSLESHVYGRRRNNCSPDCHSAWLDTSHLVEVEEPKCCHFVCLRSEPWDHPQ
jgi:hypothetical protein